MKTTDTFYLMCGCCFAWSLGVIGSASGCLTYSLWFDFAPERCFDVLIIYSDNSDIAVPRLCTIDEYFLLTSRHLLSFSMQTTSPPVDRVSLLLLFAAHYILFLVLRWSLTRLRSACVSILRMSSYVDEEDAELERYMDPELDLAIATIDERQFFGEFCQR